MRIVIKLNGYFTTGERFESSLASGDAAKTVDHPASRGHPLLGHATLKPRFDRQLFRTRSTVIQDYLAEAQTRLDELCHAVESEQQEQVAWLAEHLTEQITALHREIAAWPLRAWDSGSPGLGKWQRKRLENQEFERRLFEMKREREVRLNNSETLEEQQLLMREISAWKAALCSAVRRWMRLNASLNV